MKAFIAAFDIIPGVLWALLLAGALSLVGVKTHQLHGATTTINVQRADHAEYRATMAESGRLAERSRRDTEHKWTSRVEGAANEGARQLAIANGSIERLSAAERRVRERAEAYAAAIRRAVADSGFATAGAAARDPAGVLTDVLGKCSRRVGILASYADKARIAGKTCEASYDALTAN